MGSDPGAWLPNPWMWSNYVKAMKVVPFGRYFFNSTVVTISKVILRLFLCSLGGYTFARLRFKGREFIFIIILATMMIPWQVTLIPVFIILKKMPFFGGNNAFGVGGTGWINTYWSLIIPGAVDAFGIFLMRQFFKILPKALEDAARIDGASEFGIYWRIMLPLAKPALTTLGILTFTQTWNFFLWPLIVTTTDSMRTVQLGLTVFRSQYDIEWNLLMAAVVVITLPILFVFTLGQRYFVQGIALTGMKG